MRWRFVASRAGLRSYKGKKEMQHNRLLSLLTLPLGNQNKTKMSNYPGLLSLTKIQGLMYERALNSGKHSVSHTGVDLSGILTVAKVYLATHFSIYIFFLFVQENSAIRDRLTIGQSPLALLLLYLFILLSECKRRVH